jgi:hypothetical protein
MRECLCSKATIQSAKMAFWWTGSMASVLVPTEPFVNGLLVGSMLFMGCHALIQHPTSTCMKGAYRPLAESRTWKHITAGAALSGIGFGLGLLGMSSGNRHLAFLGIIGGCLGGFGLSLGVAYSNTVFAGRPRPVDEPLLVAEEV